MKKGFTLIEILVVITIMGILTALGSVSYINSLKSTRDTRRKSDLEQIRQALESYRSDSSTSSYPNHTLANTIPTSMAPTYINPIPTDPTTGADYEYTRLTTTTYKLCTNLENSTPSYSCVYQP